MTIERLEGWENRLEQVIESCRATPYVLGQHDCFRVACQAVEALTGIDRWPDFEGQYTSRREALLLIAKYGSSFEEAFSWFFCVKPVSVGEARRGDICAAKTEDGDMHLGVCLGVDSAFLGPEGLKFIPTLSCMYVWRIG